MRNPAGIGHAQPSQLMAKGLYNTSLECIINTQEQRAVKQPGGMLHLQAGLAWSAGQVPGAAACQG